MATRPFIIVTRRLPHAIETILMSAYDAQLNSDDEPMGEARLRAAFRDADAVLCTVGDRITAATMDTTPMRARLLCSFGVGTDHIDLDVARSRGLAVSNTPGVLTECTADLTIALMLATMRRMGEAERELRAGEWTGWRPTHMLGARAHGRTLGIVGFGRIGRAVARRAHHGFGMRILFHTPHPPLDSVADTVGASAMPSLEALLAASDIVSLHCPANETTRNLMNAERIASMKTGAFLINTARGDLVDEDALLAALRSGKLRGAGLDVFVNEPRVETKLLALDNVVVLPHIGSATLETRTEMGMRAVANLRAFFAGKPLPDPVVQPPG
jgi:lactate dehydrogenase-like 2-hydroxyacid dehydrogenase